jgi:hypothetical protein
MPIFYFHVRHGSELLADADGRELESVETAAAAAIGEARAILAADAIEGRVTFDQYIDVTDSLGRLVHRLRFLDAIVYTPPAPGTIRPEAHRPLFELPRSPVGRASAFGEAGVGEPRVQMDRLATAKAWQRASAARRRIFDEGDRMFDDPAWEILLDLFVQHWEGRPVAITDACFASKVPPTTALRWLDRLYSKGLVGRIEDRTDARRTRLFLTEEAQSSIGRALDTAVEVVASTLMRETRP